LQGERAAMRVLLCTAAALVLLTSAGYAAAQPIPASRPFVVEGHASLFGGPAGLLGAGLDVIPVPGFGVTATVGLGGGGGSAIFGLVPRLRFATSETSAVSGGVGASGGPAFQSGSLAIGDAPYRRDFKRTAFALWLDVVAAWEKELSARLRLRIYVGAEQRLLTRGKVRCYSQMGHSTEVIELPCDSPPPFTEPHGPSKFVPVMGGAFGYAF